jgi:LmbE family N-acetylglucosaminyl deacetylase
MDLPGQPRLTSATTWTTDLPVPASALAIGAHPDDVEFGCGATLAKWAANGCTIHHLICTDGSKGTWDVNADLPALVMRRQHEQREAARRLGSRGEVVFLRHIDGELDSGLRQRSEIAHWIRMLRPEVVLGHDPWRRYRLHPDHRHAGLLAVEGIVAARDPHFFAEQRAPHHRPEHLLLWEADQPTHAEDIGAFVETKLHALEAHESQFETTMHTDAIDLAASLERFRQSVRDRLTEQGQLADHAASEVFARMSEL